MSMHNEGITATKEADPPEHKQLTTVKRIIMLLMVFFTAWQVFATFLWIAPYSGLREVVPGELLHDYMIPMQGQSWSVFAPNPINGDYHIQVRAVVEKDGKEVETDWVDATKAELTMLTHNLFPPRAAGTSIDLGSRFKSAYDDLNKEQKDIVALGYYDGNDWRDRLETALNAKESDGSKSSDVADYMNMERLADAYATQVAYAMWGEDEVTKVQFIVSRQNVIPFEKRNDPKAKRPAVQTAPTGWRGTIVEPGQSQQDFADIFIPAVKASNQ